MRPHSRPSPRSAAAANNPQTNPARTNNSRDPYLDRPSPQPDTLSSSDRRSDAGFDETEMSQQTEQKNNQKVNQVIQNFFTKAALSIVSSRIVLPRTSTQDGAVKQNKWFNVVLDDTDALLSPLAEWKSVDAVAGQPAPLVIDIYVDISSLGHQQSLVIHDGNGKRWEVAEALSGQVDSAGRPVKPTELVLERWTVQIGDRNSVHPSELRDSLPNVYKKAVVLFRALFAFLRLMPAFKYYKTLARQPANHPTVKLNYRIYSGAATTSHPDTLPIPLCPATEDVLETQIFEPSNSPVGPLSISVKYRSNCEFGVIDSESLLSSQFMGLDDDYVEQGTQRAGHVPGSLPVNKLHPQETPDLGQAYGSMSTFHQAGVKPGTSPISALRAVRDMPSLSPSDSPPQKLPPNHRTAQGSKSSLRSIDTPSAQRRPSVSFQPFKAGSLSSSPAPGPAIPPSPGSLVGRPGSSLGRQNPLTQPRNRTSLTALPQTALRTPSLSNEAAITSSASSSPKPAPITRYSSSFGHRRSRFSSSGASRLEDDNVSSGKASASSSQQPGSEMLNEGEGGGSSGSLRTDDENISDFLKILEQKRDLRSFQRSEIQDTSTRRATTRYSQYQRAKDPHGGLSDSLTSSQVLHRSSTSSSRQLSSVPQMIAGTSFSTSSSPGKPISPHTPHTPAIPSRLSANSIIEYEPPRRSRSRPRTSPPHRGDPTANDPESTTRDIAQSQGTSAIDIPTSPRPWKYIRRPSSAAEQPSRSTEEDPEPEPEPDLFGVRSASLPAHEGEGERDLQRITANDLTSSGLFAQTELLASAMRNNDGTGDVIGPPDLRTLNLQDDNVPRVHSTSDIAGRHGRPYAGSNARGRGLYSRGGSSTSLATGGTGSVEGGRQSRYTFSAGRAAQHSSSAHVDDDEPLLFQMSEIGSGSRRSIEEARGGGSSGSAAKRGGGSSSGGGVAGRLGGDW